MKYLTRDELRALTNDELLKYVNEYLANGGSMNSFEKYHHTTKKYIKTRLNELNVVYNPTTKQYEPIAVEKTNINTIEVVEMAQNEQNQATSNDTSLEVVSLLSDIKALLESQNSRLGSISDEVVEIKINTEANIALQPMVNNEIEPTKSVDDIKPLKSDETLIIRNFKVYPSVANRLKKLTGDTDYQVQQVFNALLDEVLTKYGY